MIPDLDLKGMALKERWIHLKNRAVFRITGPDRVRFLNGQVSNDVSGPLEQESIAACLCTIKGKVEALLWIQATEDSLILDGELRQREAIFARLDRYLIADDCELSDETEQTNLIHHFISDASGTLSRRIDAPGKDIFIPSSAQFPWDASREIAEEEWGLLSTLAGVPESTKEINSDTFPAELGLDTTAVSFHKGCYLGQEIISRIESVGKVKRRLRVIETTLALPAGVAVQNTLGEIGLTTRESCRVAKEKLVSMALFGLRGQALQPVRNEPIAAFPVDDPINR